MKNKFYIITTVVLVLILTGVSIMIFLLYKNRDNSTSENHITNTDQTNSPIGFGIFKIGKAVPENPFFSKNYYVSRDIEENGDYSIYSIYGYEHPNGYIVDLNILTYKDIVVSITFPKIEDREKIIPDIIQIFNFNLDTFIRYTHETGVKVGGVMMFEGCREHITITGASNVNQIKTTIDHYEERSIDCNDKSIEFITEYSMADMFHFVGLSITDTLVYGNYLDFLQNQEKQEKKNKVF